MYQRHFYLNCQTCAAFNSATLQNSTSRLRCNTSTEAVSAGTVTCVWLVSSLWHIPTIILQSPLKGKSGTCIFIITIFLYIKVIHTTYPLVHSINRGDEYVCISRTSIRPQYLIQFYNPFQVVENPYSTV